MLVLTAVICVYLFIINAGDVVSLRISDDETTPFAFLSDSYEAIVLPDENLLHSVVPLSPFMGVAEPFNGNPSGNVIFQLKNINTESLHFKPETAKLGNIFFLRLFCSYDPSSKLKYVELEVEAIFTSVVADNAVSIRLRNSTELRIHFFDHGGNCPFFSSPNYHMEITDDHSIHKSIGQVFTTDEYNDRTYIYLDPSSDDIPFHVDYIDGRIYPTKSLLSSESPAFIQSISVNSRKSKVYTFNVYATLRGNRSTVNCNLVSKASVIVTASSSNAHNPSIIAEIFENVKPPGGVGVTYARIKVIDEDSVIGANHTLRILEPHLLEDFQLVSALRPSEWFLQVRRKLSNISLSSRIFITLEASDEGVPINANGQPVIPHVKKKSRKVLDFPVVPRSTHRLHFPEEVNLIIPELSIPNCTIAILTPSFPYTMSNASLLFTVLEREIPNKNRKHIQITSTGAVILLRNLDVDPSPSSSLRSREGISDISLPFTVVDRNNLLLSSAAKSTLKIKVLDMNDNDPIVRNNNSVYEVHENAPIGTVVLHIDAFDPDLLKTALTYSLYNAVNLPFNVSPRGEVIVTNNLDAETMPAEFTLYFRVGDMGTPVPRNVLAIFTIHIIDVNEYAPQFVEISCMSYLSVSDSGSLNHVLDQSNSLIIGRYTAEDADRDGQKTLSIRLASSSLQRPCFRVDNLTGELSVMCSYLGPPNTAIILTLSASDGSRSSEVPFKITIRLVLDAFSRHNFTQHCKNSNVYENLQKLKIRRKEFEKRANLPFNTKMDSTNLHQPKFPADLPQRLHIPENLPIGTVILRITASDQDSVHQIPSGQLVYGIEATDSVPAESFFSVSSTDSLHSDIQQAFLLQPDDKTAPPILSSPYSTPGMVLVVAAYLDREITSSYGLILHVCDLGSPPMCASTPLHIFIEDLDDNPPDVLNQFVSETFDASKYSDNIFPLDRPEELVNGIIKIPEDVSINTRICQVIASDRDISDEVRYRLLTHNNIFKIHPRTGKIRLIQQLDRELMASYELVIELTGHSRTADQHLIKSSNYLRLLRLAEANCRSELNRRTTTRISIIVGDVNDNAPIFAPPGLPGTPNSSSLHANLGDGYHLTIPEDLPGGAYITTLIAYDVDDKLNGLVGYSLFGTREETECFPVDRLSGVVRLNTNCNLSAYRGRIIHLTAWAFDHGTPHMKSNTSFNLHVIPVHYRKLPPSFNRQPALYSGSIEENMPSGSAVLDTKSSELRLQATYSDGNPVVLHISGGSGIGSFYLDADGIIRSSRVLDAESLPDEGGYWLTVWAVSYADMHEPSSSVISDSLPDVMHALAEVFIEVIDENDNFPIPLAPEFYGQLPENSPPGLLVAHVLASDADKHGSPLHYRIASGDPQGHFTIDPLSGQVRTTARPLDREAILKETGSDQFPVMISVSDQDDTIPRTCEVRLLISLSDENDQTPQFVPLTPVSAGQTDTPFYHFRVYEMDQGQSSGCVGRVFAIDLDDSLNGTVHYWHDTIQADGAQNDFEVDSASGWICRTGSKWLPPGDYRLGVFAKDRGQPARIANNNRPVDVLITILSSLSSATTVNRLQFTLNPPTSITVRRTHLPGSRLFPFAVSDILDPTVSGLTYSLISSNGSLPIPFTLELTTPNEGHVYLTNWLDAISDTSFFLVLSVSNGYHRLVAKTHVIVDGHNLQEPLVLEAPGATTNVDFTFLNELSDLPLGSTGIQIQTNVTESLLVGSRVFNLKELLVSVPNSSATLDYSIVSTGQVATLKSFTVDSQSGDLFVSKRLDHESIDHHYLLLIIRDMSNPLRSKFINFFIHISDVNEHAPQFIGLPPESSHPSDGSRPIFIFNVNGLSAVGSVIGQVTAVDQDRGENGRITYSLIGGDTVEFFKLNPVTGELRTAKPLLPNPHNSPIGQTSTSKEFGTHHWPMLHRLVISATDNGTPTSRSNHTEVLVSLMPKAGGTDAPHPRFKSHESVHFNVMENSPPGTVISSLLRLLTPSSASYGFLHFELLFAFQVPDSSHSRSTKVVPRSLFHVTSDTGLLVPLVPLDREHHGDVHRLRIRVRGSHGIRSKLFDEITVEVHILDENDNAPSILTPLVIRGQITENSKPGSFVIHHCSSCASSVATRPIQISASDPDLGANGQIVYQFVGPHASRSQNLFVVDPNTGLLSLNVNTNVDREIQSQHTLFIQISDSGSPPLGAPNLVRVLVDVLDVNDCTPVFVEPFYVRTLLLPSYPGELIAHLKAIDEDTNDTVSYHLLKTLNSDQFMLESGTGRLRVAPNSTLHTTSSVNERTFLLEVEARDNNKPQPHVARVNVTIFARSEPKHNAQTSLIIDPEDGLDVSLIEHFSGPEPARLGQLTVRDAPIGAVYRFIVLTPLPGLTVDYWTGTILATGDQAPNELDRELVPDFTMHVLVRDMLNHWGRTTVRVHLLDVNDHKPLFINQPYHAVFCLNMGSPNRPDVSGLISSCSRANHFKVLAIDNDEGMNGTVTYSLHSVRPRAEPPLLSINPTDGRITPRRLIPPDWTGRQLEAVIRATDGGGLLSTAILTIQLVSYEGPVFSASHYTATVSESAPVGEAVTTVEATSPSLTVSLIYRLVGIEWAHDTLSPKSRSQDLTESPFELEFNTVYRNNGPCIVRLLSHLDFENVNRYELLLEVLDTSTGLSARVQLSINVTDVNDVAPKFQSSAYTIFVWEYRPMGELILQLKATDPDSGYGGQITYHLESYHPNDLASVQPSAPSLLVDCDPHSGQITLAKRLDYLSAPKHQFWAVATDQAAQPLSSRVLVTINVLDSNNHAPQFEIDANSTGICSYRAKLHEAAPAGTFVAHLLATDVDVNDTLEYQFASSQTRIIENFRLSRNDGILTWVPLRMLNGRPVFEATFAIIPPLEFQVQATDGVHSTSCNVFVEFEAANWHTPHFREPKREVWNVTENTTHLGRIQPATDDDQGKFGQISYKLIGGHYREQFRLDHSTGDLYALEALDYETIQRYQWVVRATDGGGLFDHMVLDLNVVDVNDNRPQFIQPAYELVLFLDEYNLSKENYPFQTTLCVKAIDADADLNAKLSYHLTNSPNDFPSSSLETQYADAFAMHPDSGCLSLRAALPTPPLFDGVIELIVEACDSPLNGAAHSLCSRPTPVRIRLAVRTPVPVMRPVLGCTSVQLVEDDHTVDREVAYCQIRPSNFTGNWALVSITNHRQVGLANFRINPLTGHIHTTSPLDYELDHQFELTVEFHMTDYSPIVPIRTSFQIILVDINDCVPTFDSPVYVLDVAEDVLPGTKITRVIARDPDFGFQDPITYSIWPENVLETELASRRDLTSEQSRSFFNHLAIINTQTAHLRQQFNIDMDGWISLKTSLDFRSNRKHTFTVLAIDSAGHWNSSLVMISVIDVNNNAPHWPLREEENGSLAHVLYNDLAHRQILHDEVTIPENWLPASHHVLYQLALVDPDTEAPIRPTFYLVPTEDSMHAATYFSVSPLGTIRLKRALDREEFPHLLLHFRASDGIYVTDDLFTLRVNVEDMNDNIPVCVDPVRLLTVLEDAKNGTSLVELVALDSDSDPTHSTVSYELVSGDATLFYVDALGGFVQLIGALDFETRTSHQLVVQASDEGGLACQFSILLHVHDVNDNVPEINPISISPIPEDAPVGSLVGKVTATDRDLVDTHRLAYSLESTHDASFSIGRRTGLLKISRNLDREVQGVHTLTVVVTDGDDSTTSHTVSSTFTVRLLDVNDSPPQFVNNTNRLRVSESIEPGQTLIRLEAVSMDEGENAKIHYRLLTKQQEFSLNETTGDLHLESSLDHERVSSYFLTVEARDHGKPPLSTTTVVTVEVEDVNDNQPQFVGRDPIPPGLLMDLERFALPIDFVVNDFFSYSYAFSVVENSPITTVIGRLKAVDADSGLNGRFTFTFLSPNLSSWIPDMGLQLNRTSYRFLNHKEAGALFRLDAQSGQLILNFEPDREAVAEFWLAATVADRGQPTSLSAHTLIRVNVLDINDCPPVFEKPSYEFIVEVDRAGNVSGCYEVKSLTPRPALSCQPDATGRVLIGQLKLTDADASPNAGPFTCQLARTGPVASTNKWRSMELVFVRNSSVNQNQNGTNENRSEGECLLYIADRLPIGSQSIVLRANDNGLTALHTSVTVTIRVVRQANLPPEIVNGNSTYIYYRGSSGYINRAKPQPNLVIARVNVKDRTAHDRLNFELVTGTSGPNLFRVDRYDGTIRSGFASSESVTQSAGSLHQTNDPNEQLQSSSNGFSFSRLDSGVYPLRIRVSNGTLSAEETLYMKVVSITDEMLESSIVIRVSNLMPNLFYMERYDQKLRSHVASELFGSDAQKPNYDNHVYILSIQEADQPRSASYHLRSSRSLDRAVDVLVAVYNPMEREFFKPVQIVKSVGRIINTLSTEFGGQVETIHDLCTPQFCPRGACVSRVMIDPNGLVNRVEVHRISQVSPRFTLAPTCQCPPHFAGPRCDSPLNGCSTVSCPAPRICIPQGRDTHSCICPPPRTGSNCESVQPVGPNEIACYSESCFKNREHGTLQFTGGSFIHWEQMHPDPHHLELTFAVRTRQSTGPLVTVRWSALRAFQLRLATGGRLVVSTTSLTDGLPLADWLVSAEPLSTGHWHRVRFIMTVSDVDNADRTDDLLFRSQDDTGSLQHETAKQRKNWWVELTIDGIHPRSTSVDWDLGDPVQQGILFGADLVDSLPLIPPHSIPFLGHPRTLDQTRNNKTTVLRSGIVGCFRDIRINRIKPPYQINFKPIQNNPSSIPLNASPSLVLARIHDLGYGCDPASTISGACATGPCLHGGKCSSQQSMSKPYACHCPPLFHGRHCERTGDACLLRPCQNGGSCQALFNPNTVGTPANSGLAAYRCVCPSGVSGLHCELIHDTNFVTLPDGSSPSAADADGGPQCQSTRLVLQYSRHHSATIAAASTENYPTYSISSAQNDKSVPVCMNGGACKESPSGPYCLCPLGWHGARCEHDIDECQLANVWLSSLSSGHTSSSSRKQPSWMHSHHSTGVGGLCSPYEVGRGICVNLPGSYRCNCTLGFGGRNCQTKNLIPLTPDSNLLGLTQLHIYIIVGLVAFLFLAALTIIIILACRARGLISSSIDANGLPNKLVGAYAWPPDKKHLASHKTQSPRLPFCRYSHSDGSSLTNVPFFAPSPRPPELHPNMNCTGYSVRSVNNRRPSLASSTYMLPQHFDDSTTALLSGCQNSVKHASGSSVAPTMTDYTDKEDSSVHLGASRVLLYPTDGGDPVPCVMMLSPALSHAGSVSHRMNAIPRYSPASAVLYGPTLSGMATPANQGSTTFIAYNAEPPGSSCVTPRHAHGNPLMSFHPMGHHHPHSYMAHHANHYPQLIPLRPGSVVGSDRLSLGSGSDRFSVHSNQVLVQPANVPGHQPYPSTTHMPYYQTPTPVSRDRTDPLSEHPALTLRPIQSDTLRATGVSKDALEDMDTISNSSRVQRRYQNPRPLPAHLQHMDLPSDQLHVTPTPANSISAPNLDADATPTLHKAGVASRKNSIPLMDGSDEEDAARPPDVMVNGNSGVKSAFKLPASNTSYSESPEVDSTNHLTTNQFKVNGRDYDSHMNKAESLSMQALNQNVPKTQIDEGIVDVQTTSVNHLNGSEERGYDSGTLRARSNKPMGLNATVNN